MTFYLCLSCRAHFETSAGGEAKKCPICAAPEPRYLAKPLELPAVKTFAELFEKTAPWEPRVPSHKRVKLHAKGFDAIDPLEPMKVSRNAKLTAPTKYRVPVSDFCSVSGAGRDGHDSMHVVPTDMLVQHIAPRFIGDPQRDTVGFEIVIRDNGDALVLWSNQSIISSHWITILPASEIPKLGKVA